MQVTPANVLGIYAVIMEEMTRLSASVQMFTLDHGEGMPPLGGDLVSLPAARGFTDATRRLLAKCETDIRDLNRVADGLVEAARAYASQRSIFSGRLRPEPVAEPFAPQWCADEPQMGGWARGIGCRGPSRGVWVRWAVASRRARPRRQRLPARLCLPGPWSFDSTAPTVCAS